MNLPYRWVIVAAGALMSCVAVGTMFSLAIFLEPIATDTGWSRAGISSAMTLNFIVMGLGGFAWGAGTGMMAPQVGHFTFLPTALSGARILPEQALHDVVARCAKRFGDSQLAQCANQVSSDLMPGQAALQQMTDLRDRRRTIPKRCPEFALLRHPDLAGGRRLGRIAHEREDCVGSRPQAEPAVDIPDQQQSPLGGEQGAQIERGQV